MHAWTANRKRPHPNYYPQKTTYQKLCYFNPNLEFQNNLLKHSLPLPPPPPQIHPPPP